MMYHDKTYTLLTQSIVMGLGGCKLLGFIVRIPQVKKKKEKHKKAHPIKEVIFDEKEGKVTPVFQHNDLKLEPKGKDVVVYNKDETVKMTKKEEKTLSKGQNTKPMDIIIKESGR